MVMLWYCDWVVRGPGQSSSLVSYWKVHRGRGTGYEERALECRGFDCLSVRHLLRLHDGVFVAAMDGRGYVKNIQGFVPYALAAPCDLDKRTFFTFATRDVRKSNRSIESVVKSFCKFTECPKLKTDPDKHRQAQIPAWNTWLSEIIICRFRITVTHKSFSIYLIK